MPANSRWDLIRRLRVKFISLTFGRRDYQSYSCGTTMPQLRRLFAGFSPTTTFGLKRYSVCYCFFFAIIISPNLHIHLSSRVVIVRPSATPAPKY